MGMKQKARGGAGRAGGRGGSGGGGGSPVYGIGFVGAAVWYWQQANDGKERAVGVLKALAWPGFLVYEAFKALDAQHSR